MDSTEPTESVELLKIMDSIEMISAVDIMELMIEMESTKGIKI